MNIQHFHKYSYLHVILKYEKREISFANHNRLSLRHQKKVKLING